MTNGSEHLKNDWKKDYPVRLTEGSRSLIVAAALLSRLLNIQSHNEEKG